MSRTHACEYKFLSFPVKHRDHAWLGCLQILACIDPACSCKIYDSRGNAKVSDASTRKMIKPSRKPACQCKKVIFTKINSEAILH